MVYMTIEEHNAAMREMAEFDGNTDLPSVGIFWFDPEKEELFDVSSIPAATIPNGLMTINKLHKDVWAKNYYKAKAKGRTDSIYLGDYTQIPRGRVWYNKAENRFWVTVGHWVADYEEVLRSLISFEFNISEFEFVIDEHWDLGHGWSEHDFSEFAK